MAFFIRCCTTLSILVLLYSPAILADEVADEASALEEPVVESPEEPVVESPEEPVTESPEEPVAEAPEEPVTESPEEPVAEAEGPPSPEVDGEAGKETCPPEKPEMTKREKRKRKNCIKRNDPNRLEWALLPVIGLNSDIGFIFGGNVVFAKFDEDRKPYKWRVNAFGSAAANDTGITMQNHAIGFDVPMIAGSKFRLQGRAGYVQMNNRGYYGVGNDSEFLPDSDPDKYQYSVQFPEVWSYVDYDLPHDMALLGGLRFRYSWFDFNPGSVLDEHQSLVDDAGVPILPGTDNHGELVMSIGWNIDTRDHEVATTKGYFVQLSTRGAIGPLTGTDYTFGGTALQARIFLPAAGEYLVFAGRVMADVMYGRVPFYEMSLGGSFPFFDMPGGSRSVRGIPEGRYRGAAKFIANVEARSMPIKVNLGSHRFKMGAAIFFDTGRVWMYEHKELDGEGIGLKFGTGGGVRLQWGETVMLRIDVAYSPDADPVGFYFDVGHMF